MTDKKQATRRSVSKPRLLKAVYAIMKEYNLSEEDAIGGLVSSIERDIIDEAIK